MDTELLGKPPLLAALISKRSCQQGSAVAGFVSHVTSMGPTVTGVKYPVTGGTASVVNDFGRWLRGKLSQHEMTMTAFAKRIGVSHSSVSLWLEGKRVPSPASIERIADVLFMDVDEVLAIAGHRPRLPMDQVERFRAIAEPYARRIDWTREDNVLALRGALETLVKVAEMRAGKRPGDAWFEPVDVEEV